MGHAGFVMVVVAAVLVTPARADSPASPDRTASFFVSGEIAAGGVLRGQTMAGWGTPHTSYVGLQAEGLTTTEFGAVSTALHGHLVFLDASIGLRQTWSYVHTSLPSMTSYEGLSDTGAAARYTTLDASVTLYAPAPGGFAMLWTDVVHPLGTSRPVFEEYTRVVIGAQGTTVDARLAYLVPFRKERWIAGPMVEHVWIGGRDATSVRAGATMSWTASPRWSVIAALTTPVSGEDHLGAWNGLWGTAVVRYRWAMKD